MMATKYIRVLRSLNLPIPGYDKYTVSGLKQWIKHFSFPWDCHRCTSKTYTLSKHLFTDLQKQSNRLNRLLNYFFSPLFEIRGKILSSQIMSFSTAQWVNLRTLESLSRSWRALGIFSSQ